MAPTRLRRVLRSRPPGPSPACIQWSAPSTAGDANNLPALDITNANEQVTVSPASPTISTTPNLTTVTLANSNVTLKDLRPTWRAVIRPTGTVTFTLIAPGGGTVDTETASVSGNGSYTTPAGYTLLRRMPQ